LNPGMDDNSIKKGFISRFAVTHNGPDCGILRCVFARTLMWLTGWKATGTLPRDNKFILIGEPHTSNWDFLLMFGAAYSFRLKISWLGKNSIFKKPFGTLMKYFGGIPINRNIKDNLVKRTVELFNESEKFVLVIGPSGTRSKRYYWRSGFYWIAHTANIPVLCGYLDFVNKIVHVGLCFVPTGDVKKDMDRIREYYKDIRGKHPELENRILLKDE